MKRLIPILTLGLALSVRLMASPIVPVSYSYNQAPGAYGDETGVQLTDGFYVDVIPQNNLGYGPHADNWVGFFDTAPSITFNFGGVVTLDNVTISMAKWNEAGVYLPSQVVVGSSAFTVNDGAYINQDHAVLSLDGSWTGSSLTISMTPQYAQVWTFIDEVIFNEAAPGNQTTVPDTAGTLGLMSLSVALLVAARRRFAA